MKPHAMTEPDWAQMLVFAQQGQAIEFGLAVQHAMRMPGHNFKVVQTELLERVLFSELDTAASLAFVLTCLESATAGPAPPHVAAPAATSRASPTDARAGIGGEPGPAPAASAVAAAATAAAAAQPAAAYENSGGDAAAPSASPAGGVPDASSGVVVIINPGSNSATFSAASVINFLMLELVPADLTDDVLRPVAPRAAALFEAALQLRGSGVRTAVKLALVFRIQRGDVTSFDAVVACVQAQLEDRQGYGAAVALLMHFEGLAEHVDMASLLAGLVHSGQDSLSEKYIATLSRDDQVVFVEQCVAQDRLRPAIKAVRAFGLTPEFPEIEATYKQRGLARLVERLQWGVATSFVGNDRDLQASLLEQMVAAGEMSLAQTACRQFGLPDSTLVLDPKELADEAERRKQQYLGLALPASSVLFVSSRADLAVASAALHAAPLVGMDVEWKPRYAAGGGASPASVLQVATPSAVFLFDLILLGATEAEALDACLLPLMASPSAVKLGFALAGDLSKLSSSYPALACFQCVTNVFDIKDLWMQHAQNNRISDARAVGLSTLCKAVLGKPLDKAMQVSDWEARPLSERQTLYAAQDAHVLLLLHDRLVQLMPVGAAQQLITARCSTFQPAGQSRKRREPPAQQ